MCWLPYLENAVGPYWLRELPMSTIEHAIAHVRSYRQRAHGPLKRGRFLPRRNSGATSLVVERLSQAKANHYTAIGGSRDANRDGINLFELWHLGLVLSNDGELGF